MQPLFSRALVDYFERVGDPTPSRPGWVRVPASGVHPRLTSFTTEMGTTVFHLLDEVKSDAAECLLARNPDEYGARITFDCERSR